MEQVCFRRKPAKGKNYKLSPVCQPRFESEMICDMDSCLGIDLRQLGKKRPRSIRTSLFSTRDEASMKETNPLKLVGVDIRPEQSLSDLPEENKKLFTDFSIRLTQRTKTSTARHGLNSTLIQATNKRQQQILKICRFRKAKMQPAL